MGRSHKRYKYLKTLYEWVIVEPSNVKRHVRVQWKDGSSTLEPLTRYWKDALGVQRIKKEWTQVMRVDSKRVHVTWTNGEVTIEPLNRFWRKHLRINLHRQHPHRTDLTSHIATQKRQPCDLTNRVQCNKLDLLLQAVHFIQNEE